MSKKNGNKNTKCNLINKIIIKEREINKNTTYFHNLLKPHECMQLCIIFLNGGNSLDILVTIVKVNPQWLVR